MNHIRVPLELTKNKVKARMDEIHHPHSGNDRFISKCCEFLKFLYVKEVKTDTSNTGGYVHLMASILGKYLGNNTDRVPLYYSSILEALEAAGYIIIKRNYRRSNGLKKGQAMGYKLVLPSSGEMVSDTLGKKYQSEWSVDDSNYLNLIHSIELDQIRYVFVANTLPKPTRDHAMALLEYWRNKAHYVTVDRYGRIHSLLSQMPKELRCSLSIGGAPIYEVDIHACQPTLLLMLLVESLNNTNKNNCELGELRKLYPDLDRYVTSIQQGKFYEVLYRQNHSLKKKAITPSQMAEFKEMLLAKVVFDRPPAIEEGITKCFSLVYPTVYQELKTLKFFHGHEYVARRLQRLESDIMNEVLVIIGDNTNSWHLRLHDAVLCLESDVTLIQDVIKSVLERHLGFDVNVKTGVWSKSVNEVLNKHAILDHKNYLHQTYHTNRLKALGKKRRKIYVDKPNDEKIKERKSIFYVTLRDDEDRAVTDEMTYINPDLVCPSEWNEVQFLQLKNLARTTIQPILNTMPHNTEFEILVANKVQGYWEAFFNSEKTKNT